MDATNAVDELLDYIADAAADLDPRERVMVLCTVSEHCKAYAETMLAHDYHVALYGRRQVSE
ncbi:MAG: hypothetical protein IKG84_04675 [Bacteroidales bacterium]|nr:hypothetical protein [Bacteroidales bacterium]